MLQSRIFYAFSFASDADPATWQKNFAAAARAFVTKFDSAPAAVCVHPETPPINTNGVQVEHDARIWRGALFFALSDTHLRACGGRHV